MRSALPEGFRSTSDRGGGHGGTGTTHSDCTRGTLRLRIPGAVPPKRASPSRTTEVPRISHTGTRKNRSAASVAQLDARSSANSLIDALHCRSQCTDRVDRRVEAVKVGPPVLATGQAFGFTNPGTALTRAICTS